MQGQAEKVVDQSAEDSVCVDQALDPGPSNLSLELLEVKGAGVKQGRGWTSRDVVAQEGEDIDQDGQTERDDKGARAGEGLAVGLILTCFGDKHTGLGTHSREASRRATC